MWNLKFITRENLKQHIKKHNCYIRKTFNGIDLSKFNSNIVDPIKWYLIVKFIGKTLKK